MEWLEKILFENFRQMPMPVRIFVYLFLLFVFTYLLLLPRFIEGKLVYKSALGGEHPYRGADLQMRVAGRTIKFKSDEDGYWSAPVLSRIPEKVDIELHHSDQDTWSTLTFDAREIWRLSLSDKVFKYEVSSNPLGVKRVMFAGHDQSLEKGKRTDFGLLTIFKPATALAGALEIPRSPQPSLGIPMPRLTPPVPTPVLPCSTGSQERLMPGVKEAVYSALSRFVPEGQISPELSLSAPSTSYFQRIDIITMLENKYKLRIPDEHWTNLNTVGELVQYMNTRLILQNELKQKGLKQTEQDTPNWQAIQQMYAKDKKERPKFIPEKDPCNIRP